MMRNFYHGSLTGDDFPIIRRYLKVLATGELTLYYAASCGTWGSVRQNKPTERMFAMFMPLAYAVAKAAAPNLGRYFAEQALKTLAAVGVTALVTEAVNFIHKKLDPESERPTRKPTRTYRAFA